MPTYEYLCQSCGERLEVFQKFSAKPLKVHDECGGALQKVFHASGVVFKGSGYYVTDSRGSGSAPTSSDKKTETKADPSDKSGNADKPAAKDAKSAKSSKPSKSDTSTSAAAAS